MAVIRLNGTTTSNFPTGGDVQGEVSLGSKSIGELSDVNITGAANGKILIFNGTSNQFEIGDDTDTGITDVVQDTSPQLGGNLDLNSSNITGTGNITNTGVITASNTTESIIANNTNASGNSASSLLVKRTASNLTRGINQNFQITDGGSNTHSTHQIRSRRFGSDTAKRLQFFDVKDDGSGINAQLLELRLDSSHTATNQHAQLKLTGRISIDVADGDDLPNSNVTTVNLDGTTVTSHNMLTGRLDFGSSSIANDAQVTFTGECVNDAGGGASSPDRIGQLVFRYGSNEADNKIIMNVQNHDLSSQSSLTVAGTKAEVSVGFVMANLSSDPTGQNGMIYYNTSSNKFRGYANGAWTDLH